MKFKSDVSIIKFSNPSVMKILDIVELTSPIGYEPTCTSANDGKHSDKSKHYTNEAFDIRTRDYPGFKLYTSYSKTKYLIWDWINKMKTFLPKPDYDIIFDTKGHKNHIHIEYDPKYKYTKNNDRFKGYIKD